LLSDLQQVMSRSTREFLLDVRQVLPHVILVLTKADRALENALDGEDNPDAQLEAARRIGVRRFATDMGRDPGEVLTLAVAAAPAARSARWRKAIWRPWSPGTPSFLPVRSGGWWGSPPWMFW
jgi:hypothetical protein